MERIVPCNAIALLFFCQAEMYPRNQIWSLVTYSRLRSGDSNNYLILKRHFIASWVAFGVVMHFGDMRYGNWIALPFRRWTKLPINRRSSLANAWN